MYKLQHVALCDTKPNVETTRRQLWFGKWWTVMEECQLWIRVLRVF
jgi:hypothetical protein